MRNFYNLGIGLDISTTAYRRVMRDDVVPHQKL